MDTPHSYGPACRLAPVAEPEPDDARLDGIPPIHAQFFYHSLIPLDDPLSTATVSTSVSDKSSSKALRPFSHADNNALERAWLGLASPSRRSSHRASRASRSPEPFLAAPNSEKLLRIVDCLVRKHKGRHAHENQPKTSLEPPLDSLASTTTPVCCQELLIDASNLLRESFCEIARRKQKHLGQEHVVEKVMAIMEKHRPAPIVVPARMAPSMSTSSPRTEGFVLPGLSTSLRGRASSLASNTPVSRSASTDSRPQRLPLTSAPQPDRSTPKQTAISVRPPTVDDGISGKPFLKVEDDGNKTTTATASTLVEHDSSAAGCMETKENNTNQLDGTSVRTYLEGIGTLEEDNRSVQVPVGVSRLHTVHLPALQMKPIYWSPVNDIAIVSRFTWFYR